MNYRTQIILISHENKGRRVHTPNKYLLTYQKKEKKEKITSTNKYKTKITKKISNNL